MSVPQDDLVVAGFTKSSSGDFCTRHPGSNSHPSFEVYMFRKLLSFFFLALLPIAAQAQSTHTAVNKTARPTPQQLVLERAAARQKTTKPRPARTPQERLLIPYLQKHLASTGATSNAATRTDAQSAPAAPNFGGYLTAPYYPAHPNNACIIDTSNCGVSTALVADYDKDGNADVAVLQFDGTLNILLGDGKGGFAAPVVYSNPNFASTQMLMAVAVDVNGDGYTDLVALDQLNNALLIYLNQKNGTFTAPVSIILTNIYGNFNSFALGDVNGDGKLDVVALAANITSQTTTDVTVQTYLGNGDGTFQGTTSGAAAYTGTVTIPAQVNIPGNLGITLGDINGDGKLDLAADFLEQTSQTVGAVVASIALGDGTGSFGALNVNNPVNIPFVATGAPFVIVSSAGVQLVDLNKDSKLDLAVDGGGSFYVAIGNGSGGFATPVSTPGLPEANEDSQIVYADFNGDGIPDLVVEDGLLSVWLGKGDGTFSIPSAQYVVDSGPNQELAVYDFNGDGKLDVAQLGGSYKQLSFFSGNGAGGLHGATVLAPTFDPVPTAPYNYLAAAGDLNGDGLTDVILIDVANPNGQTEIATGLSDGNGNFTYQSALPPLKLINLAFIEPLTADFNKDGKQDVVLANADGTVTVAISNGDGTFQSPVALALPTLGCTVQYAAAADLNGDGNIDLVIAYGGDVNCGGSGDTPSGYFVALGNGNGTFQTPTFTPYGTQLYAVTIADMNGDGKLDLLLDDAPFNGGTFAVDLLPGNGAGTFGAGAAVLSNYLVSQVSVSDYNQDGKPDLVLFSEGEQTDVDAYATAGILLLPNNGDGTFGAATEVATGNFFLNGAVVDVNGDGIPDIEAPLYQPAGGIANTYYGFSTLLGLGGGGFAPPVNALQYTLGELPLPGNFVAGNSPSFVVSTPTGTALYLAQAGTTISLTASASSVAQGQTVSFTATVAAGQTGRPSPTGSVSFYDGTTLLGSAPLSGSTAVFTTSGLATGSHSITAVYGGDDNFNFNTSTAVPISVTAVSPGFTLTATPGTVTVPRGQNGLVTLAITANATFSGSVSLACSGLPATATCTLSPATVSLTAGGSGSSTLIIGTTNRNALHMQSQNHSPWGKTGAVLSMAALLWIFTRRRTMPRMFSILLVAGLALAGISLSGCGGGSSVKTAPTGNYTVTITATSSNSSITPQTTTVAVTIQ